MFIVIEKRVLVNEVTPAPVVVSLNRPKLVVAIPVETSMLADPDMAHT